MKPILHIVRNPDDKQAIKTIENQAKDNAYGVTVIFIHDGLSVPSIPNVRTYILSTRGTSHISPKKLGEIWEVPPKLIGYDEILNLIFSVESITVW